MTLEGRVAVVTGASKGMGSHFVDALVAAGARVACLARASVELDAVVAKAAKNLPVEDEGEWNWDALAKWANARFGLNLRDRDLQRIVEQRLSPLYVSVHCTDDDVRASKGRNG